MGSTTALVEDNCNKVAADTSLKTACTTTADGATPPKKCCLATFNALPQTQNKAKNVQDPAKGGKVESSKYYACYKSGGGFRFKTATGATVDGKEAWATAADFCGTGKVGTAISHAKYSHTAGTWTDVTAGGSTGLSGTAATCVCGSSVIASIGFS